MDTGGWSVVIDGGAISFTGPSLTLTSSDVGLDADAGTITLDGAADVEAVDGAIAQNGGTILVKGPLTVRTTDTSLVATEIRVVLLSKVKLS